MHPPFSAEQFFDVFGRYNEEVWPAPIVLIAVGLLSAFGAYRANVDRSWGWARSSIVLLAVLWAWSGIVYHNHFFASLSSVGRIFATFFVAEAILLVVAAWQNGSNFEPASRSSLIVGASVITYALVVYPALGFLVGQRYPELPTFGVPCPTTIFTFGIFCLLPAIPRFAIAIPILWALVASYAAIGFGVPEDFGLIVAATAAIIVIHYETHQTHDELAHSR